MSKFKIDGKVFLAPMAGVTDLAFREICKKLGCSLTYTEMVSAKALYYENKKTHDIIAFSKNECPAAVQVFGHEPYILAKACEKFEKDDRISTIDVNMGCPAPKIVKNGDGAALLNDRKLASKIIKEMKKTTSKPITAKIRKGFKLNENTCIEFSKELEESEIDAICIHGRTREQYYQGFSDWSCIKDVKKNVSVPVIGNGDIKTSEDALSIIEKTDCDYIMVARGALGNPWIFEEINSKLNGLQYIEKNAEDKVHMCIHHLKKSLEYYGEYIAVREMRKHIGWYLKGLINSIEVKNRINMEDNAEKVIKILEQYILKLRS